MLSVLGIDGDYGQASFWVVLAMSARRAENNFFALQK
jgi:hypothetical protein